MTDIRTPGGRVPFQEESAILDVRIALPEWKLYFATLRLTGAPDDVAIGEVLREQAAAARRRYAQMPPSDDPLVRAARKAFKLAGADPTRHRPAYEALVRRVLKGVVASRGE